MKAVLLSIQPQWCEKIASGEKTVEVRKNAPKLGMPFMVYMYCTKGKTFLYKNPNNGELFLDSNGGCRGGDYEDRYLTGKVIGEFICDKVDAYTFSNYEAQYRINDVDLMKTCLNFPELIAYGKGKTLYGWHISDLKIYNKPKDLREFKPWCEKHIIAYDPLDVCCDCKKAFYDEDGAWFGCGLARPPQSWCYVEELE